MANLNKKNFLILTMGYTAVGKSTIGCKLSRLLDVDIFHSAVTRKKLGIITGKEKVESIFSYKDGNRERMDKLVYCRNAENAENSLKKGRNVFLDAGYFFKWQRQQVYEKVCPLNTEIFIIRVLCDDEEEIKKRLVKRAKEFFNLPLNEAPSWDIYLETKEITELPYDDILPHNQILNIIEYDSLTQKVKFVQGNENSENTKKILKGLEKISEKTIFIQDKNFNFIKINENKISEITKDKFVIGLDFDGVITYPWKLKAEYLKKLCPRITEEQTSRKSCLELGITKKDYELESIKAYTESPNKLPLEKGFIENLLKINSLDNTTIFILTSRLDHMTGHLQKYLKYHKIKIDGIIHTKNQSKTKWLKKIQAQIFVDDTPSKLNQILKDDKEIFEKCCLVFYRNISNENELNPHKRVVEINNWNDLVKIIIKKHKEHNITKNI